MFLLENDFDAPLSNLDFENGIVFLIDKPIHWTSFDVVNKLRWELRRITKNKKIKVGHAGTLDPLATGLLLICSGKLTKRIDELMAIEKSYTGTIQLGATTPSLDAETQISETFPTEHIVPATLEAARSRFIGDIEQIPPIFSAIKVDGERLYKDAHKGNYAEAEEKLKPRAVQIHDFAVRNLSLENKLDFYVRCSKGTYIRSLARDFGTACDSGGYLSALRRTAIGEFSVEKAWNLEQLIQKMKEIS
ncbi:MAG: tRNA pseudouridine(55) synthase TruB [Bacteroidota bacterium]|jgi:tRNA pseudouridine55 synthase